MTELTLKLPDHVRARWQHEAERLGVPLDTVVNAALERYFDEDEPTKDEILSNLRQAMKDAIAGNVRPAREVLAELREEIASDADGS